VAVAGCAGAPVADYAVRGNAAGVQAHLARGASPEGTDYKGRRALELAVIKRHVRVVEILVEAGADVDHIGRYGKAPLHHAAARGPVEVVDILVRGGANVNERSLRGNTPLLDAIEAGQSRLVPRLLAAGADPNAATVRGSLPLHLAIDRSDESLVRALLAAGADPDVPDARGVTARALASKRRHERIARLIRTHAKNGHDAGAAAPWLAPPPVPGAAPSALPRPAPAAPPPLAVASGPPELAGFPAVPAGVDFGRYHALVIGNDAYRDLPRLRTARGDARAVAGLLRDRYGFEVTLLLNGTRGDILKALRRYRTELGASDNLLIYYAGHGWLDREADQAYWLPVDATPGDEVNWISNASITGAVRAMQARHVLIVADSCYAGKLARGVRVVRRSPAYLSRIANRRARVVLTSGGLEPVIDGGGTGRHSVFAAAFLAALESNPGVLEGHELFGRIKRPVMVNSDQMPEYADLRKAGHDGGDFLFVRRR
jgi:ankyrin repeat protein